MKKLLKGQGGFAFIVTIIGLAIMSILGIAIITNVTANYKVGRVDSRSQSAYYIAEAGINYTLDKINAFLNEDIFDATSAEEFFNRFNNEFTELKIENFKENGGIKPVANITIEEEIDGEEENTRKYNIVSIGEIGSSKRILSSVISMGWKNEESNLSPLLKDVFIHGSNIHFKGDYIKGEGGTILTGGFTDDNSHGGYSLNVSTMYFDGPVKITKGSVSLGCKKVPGNIYVNGKMTLDNWGEVYGNIYVNGDLRVKGTTLNNDVFVNGDFEISNYPEIKKEVQYTGNFIYPPNFPESIKQKCKKVTNVPSFKIPQIDYKLIGDEEWYANMGYLILEAATIYSIPDNAKIFSKTDFSGTAPENIKGDIIIVSKGNINLKAPWGGCKITGALIAPNGNIEVGQEDFTGLIISKNDFSSNVNFGSTMDMLKLDYFFPNEKDIPFTVSGGNGSGNDENNGDENNNDSNKINFKIVKSIKEI